jgi:aldose 1-epimerase
MKRAVALLVLGLVMVAGAPQERSVSAQESARPAYVEIKREAFQKDVNGKRVDLYTLKNRHGMVVKITNQGGKIVQLLVPDRNNVLGDVVLGYDTLDQYMAGRASMGAIVGRYANRIAQGRLVLNGQTYQLPINNGPNHLHGGKGTQFLVFDARQIDERTLQLHYAFKDGEEGYSGNTGLRVLYAVTDDNELIISYEAVTDKPTVVNFTNHAFFNLAGEGRRHPGHELTLNADRFTPIDDTSIPTGSCAR